MVVAKVRITPSPLLTWFAKKKKEKEKKSILQNKKDRTPELTLFGVPDAVGDENTFPFSHMLLILRTPSAGTGRSEAAGFVGFAAFVP